MDGGDASGFMALLQEYGWKLLIGMVVLVAIGVLLGMSEGKKRVTKRKSGDGEGG